MRWNICLLVDSNLKNVGIGMDKCGVPPYLRCSGDIFCVYKVEPNCSKWPSISYIQQRRYTDIVIALGINHCCKSRDSQDKAISVLSELYAQYRHALPGIRLYFVHVPPSLNSKTSFNAKRFNDSMDTVLDSLKVPVVKLPEKLFTENGTLNPEYARHSELAPSFPDHRRLHLNREAQSMVVCRIKRTLCVTANKRMR